MLKINIMEKNQKSHISISSVDSNYKTSNDFCKNNYKYNNINNNELDIKKLILISLKNTKYLERNDYFFSKSNKQKTFKKIKLKLTPFQIYEKFKMYSNKKQKQKQRHINNSILNCYPLTNILSRNNNLITIKNYNIMKKNKSDLNKIFKTNYTQSYLKRNIKPRINKRMFISSIDNNKINNIIKTPSIRNKRNLYLNDSYDINFKKNINKSNKICQTNNRNRTFYNNLFNDISNSKTSNNAGILPNSVHSIRIVNLKAQKKKLLGFNKNKIENKKIKMPLIHMNESKFVNKIISFYK